MERMILDKLDKAILIACADIYEPGKDCILTSNFLSNKIKNIKRLLEARAILLEQDNKTDLKKLEKRKLELKIIKLETEVKYQRDLTDKLLSCSEPPYQKPQKRVFSVSDLPNHTFS